MSNYSTTGLETSQNNYPVSLGFGTGVHTPLCNVLSPLPLQPGCMGVSSRKCQLEVKGKGDHARMSIGGVLISLSVAVEPIGG